MPDIAITVASGSYDRIRALKDGTLRVPGCAIDYHLVEPNELFVRNLKKQEFDVSEMSFSTYIALREQGRAHYTAIPVFLSRAFRHSAIFVRRGIASAADLRGKRVGVSEYFTTMAVWMRGLLADEYGIRPSDLRWRTGGLERPAAAPSTALPAVPLSREAGEEIEAVPPGKTLAGMLQDGELDALFSARPPSCFVRGDAGIVRLFPDYRTAEQAYFRKTGIFPMMHTVGIRNRLIEDHPWLAARLFSAYCKAKDMAVAEFEKLSAFALTLPWIEAEYRATQAVIGKDVWPYGLDANQVAIATLCRYLQQQGLTRRRMTAAELFAPIEPEFR